MNSGNPQYTLSKSERLCSHTRIRNLFSDGNTFLVFPLKFVWIKGEFNQEPIAQTAFTASKKSFKRAVHRNQIKRQLREAYRLNKPDFYMEIDTGTNEKINLMVIFIAKELLPYKRIENAMKKGLAKMAALLKEQNNEE
ncbi:ribonuclease P protein component [Prolixibacteraceae bacterium JC049]|nr:ribonuclease P protein component [Prolixibacteraceae bacterium JC049]